MKILFIGDIFGTIGKKMVEKHLEPLKRKHEIDFVIANAENVTNSKGLKKSDYTLLKSAGVDVFTMGNHAFFQSEIHDYIESVNDLIIPINFSPFIKYEGSKVFTVKGKKIRVTNVMGHSFLQTHHENFYYSLQQVIEKDTADIHFVDFHGETTSEKVACAIYFKDYVKALVGTHTHVQTADERIIDNKTAFITDVGSTGPADGIIGADPESVIKRMRTNLNAKFTELQKGAGNFCAVVIEFDKNTNRPKSIERINIRDNNI